MTNTKKVDCSALYPYFDSLAKEEATFKDDNVPVYVYLKHQLKYIHELFEGVLGLTLGEVKTLYFERKMSKSNLNKKEEREDSKFITKKAIELRIGDKILLASPAGVVEITELKAIEDSHIRFTWEDSFRTYLKNTLVDVLKE